MFNNYKKSFAFLLITLLLTFISLNAIPQYAFAADSSTSGVLQEGRELIKDVYLYDVPADVLNRSSLDDIVAGLTDPYSAHLSAAELKNLIDRINNSQAGFGIYAEATSAGIKVTYVLEGSPAEEAGIMEGDIITMADGHSLAGLSDAEVQDYLGGQVGSTATLRINRGDSTFDVTIERSELSYPTVDGGIIDDHIGYLSISSFGENTAQEFSDALNTLKEEKVKSYIIDLRYNPGGLVDTAVEIAGHFIGNNTTYISRDKYNVQQKIKALSVEPLIDKPVVFLVNGYSASASEILTAAVKDYRKAFIIGENTYGKGVAQEIYLLSDESALKLTTMEFLSPLGKTINKKGIAPQLPIADDYSKDIDSLSAAIILLSTSSNSQYRSGLMKYSADGFNFEIDKKYLSDPYLKATADYLATNVFNNTNTTQWYKGRYVTPAEYAKLKEAEAKAPATLTLDALYSNAYWAVQDTLKLKTQASINEARTAIKKLPAKLNWAIGEFSKQVDKVQGPKLTAIVRAILIAQTSLKQEDINKARALIEPELPSLWRSSYSSAVDKIQIRLTTMAQDAVNKALASGLKEDIDAAKAILTEIKTATSPQISAWSDLMLAKLPQ